MARRRGVAGWLGVLVAIAIGVSIFSDDDDPPQRAVVTPPGQTAPQGGQPATIIAVRYVDADSLNVRAAPSTTAAIIGGLARGQQVGVVEFRSGWARIAITGGAPAWVSDQFLSDRQPAAVAKQPSPPAQVAQSSGPSRADAIRAIIAASLASYSGNCPCPENRDRAGRRCGKRSAWSRGGGASPLCYASDVTEAMIENWLARQ